MIGERLADRVADRMADRMSGKTAEEIDAENKAKAEAERAEKAKAKEERSKKKSEKPSDGRTTKWDYFKHGLKGGILIVRLENDPGHDLYRSYETLSNWSVKQAIALGYRPARGYLTGWEAIPLKVYVKFENFRPAKLPGELNLESAGTLYDYMASDAQDAFMKGVHNAKKFDALDMKKLGMMAIVAVGVVFGMIILAG